jgi:hypothetical protein
MLAYKLPSFVFEERKFNYSLYFCRLKKASNEFWGFRLDVYGVI